MDFIDHTSGMKPLAVLVIAALWVAAWAGDASAQATPSAPKEAGAMLRAGTWDGGIGSYDVPPALSGIDPAAWPAQGWHRLRVEAAQIEIEPVAVPRGGRPAFLSVITEQVRRLHANEAPADATTMSLDETEQRVVYLRVPGVRWRSGAVPMYRFQNGTAQLRPKLDHRYELKLGEQPFAFSVQNGLRGRQGEAYGTGAHYTIEYGGQTFRYSLDGYGWDTSIAAIADLDGDGKPDFLIHVSGANAGTEYLLLSSKAKPGRNLPTASLHSNGC